MSELKIEIERDWVKIEGQVIYRPERVILGDWLSFWDAAVSPVNYQELRQKIRDAENEAENSWQEAYDKGFEEGLQAAGDMP